MGSGRTKSGVYNYKWLPETLNNCMISNPQASRQSKMVGCLGPILSGLIKDDNKDDFVRRIQHEAESVGGYDVYQSLKLLSILINIHSYRAIKCGTALVQGETGLKPDINAVDPRVGFTLLHLVSDNPVLIEFYLRHDARTDIRCEGRLPLDSAIQGISNRYVMRGAWSTRQSVYMTIVLMCGFHDMDRHLDCVRLLFRATKEVEKEIYGYVKDGKLIEIAALLTVAREEVTSPSLFKGLCDPDLNGSMSLRQLVLSEIVSLMASQIALVSTTEEVLDELNNKLETMMSMLRMIEVFERCFPEFWAAQMACILIGEGLAEYEDFEFKRIFEWNLYEGMQLESGTRKIYKQHDVDPMWIPRLSNQPSTLGVIPIFNNEYDARGSLPLKVSLEKLCHHQYLNDWTPKKSTFKLVCILCLPQLKESLESIRLAACKTDEMEAIGCNLARHGKLVELASLLMVAPEKLIVTTSPGSKDLCSNAIRRCIMSDLQVLLDSEVRLTGRSKNHKLVEKCKDEKETKLSALLLLEVFERAGNSINRYLQSDTYDDGRRSRLEIAGDIQNLLEKAGFAMKHSDTDLNDIKCFSPTMDPVDYTRLPSALLSHQFSVAQKKHLFDMQRGSRSFHTMVLGNSKCRGTRVSSPTSKALKPGTSTVSVKNRRWFLSLGVAITNVIKRV
ncbi:hypothetical protein V6N13_012901 [Hibiscus sabdariffa]|uniref:Uncharacterized protein n=1 Tax=Hibiscus sabdariffa TaxID=183260 RepID=A0ABR1ZDY9_9ROSI